MARVWRAIGQAPRNERGVTTVEFALLSVPLFLLVFGVIDFGLGIWTYNNLSQAATQGAREAIVRGAESTLGQRSGYGNDGTMTCAASPPPPATSIAGQVCTYAHPLDSAKLTVTITWACDPCLVGSPVTVNAAYVFEPVLSTLFPVAINLRSEATMRVACCQ